jgi:hypothetical protein
MTQSVKRCSSKLAYSIGYSENTIEYRVKFKSSDRFYSIKLFCTGGAVCKGATPSVEQPVGRGFKPRLQSLLD